MGWWLGRDRVPLEFVRPGMGFGGVPWRAGVLDDFRIAGLEQGGEFGHLFGMLGREVGRFRKILGQVEEQGFLVFALWQQEFPIVFPDASRRALRGVVEELGAGRVGVGGEQGGDVHAVDLPVGGERSADEAGDGGEQVDGRGELVAGGPGGDASGSPHHAGHALAALEVGALAVAERLGRSAVVLEREPRAVVAGVDDVGVFRETFLAQRVHEPADLRIDVLDDALVGVFRVGITDVLRHEERDVRHAVGQVEEEGLVFVRGDEPDGAVGVAAGDRALVAGHLDDLLVSHERRVPVLHIGGLVRPRGVAAFPALPLVVGMVHVVRVGDAVVAVEALGAREGLGVVAEVPLADARGGVAERLEVVGDGDLFRVQAALASGKEDVLFHADALRVATGQQARPRRGADRAGDHEVGELPSLLRHPVDVRRLDRLRTEAAEVVVALVVGEDDDEVRTGRLGGGAERNENHEEEKQAHDRHGNVAAGWCLSRCDGRGARAAMRFGR